MLTLSAYIKDRFISVLGLSGFMCIYVFIYFNHALLGISYSYTFTCLINRQSFSVCFDKTALIPVNMR